MCSSDNDYWWSSVTRSTRPISVKNNRVEPESQPSAKQLPVESEHPVHAENRGGGAPGYGKKSVLGKALQHRGSKNSTCSDVRSNKNSTSACTEQHGAISYINHSTKAKVDKGKYNIDNVIDLHGCTKDEAFDKLVSFLIDSFAAGHKCVLVITGWGSKSAGENSIKSNLHKWLLSDKVIDIVLYYTQATSAHGGVGAFYVLLRSNNRILKS